jgi:hypothetical protein
VSLLLFPVKRAGSTKSLSTNESFAISSSDEHAAKADAILEAASEVIYDSLGLNTLGLSKEAMLYAYKGQQKLEEEGKLSNPDILTVCDFSQSSQSKRMYIIDTRNYKVLMNTYVAHGRNSGLDYAEHFSNAPESLESSLGFYITKNTYIGKHGLSLKIEGLERGYNDNAESREVVVHGAPYIGDSRARAAYMGRSFGCPAVPQKIAPKVINLIKNGTCLFIYHPSRSYLQGSKILNG